MQIITGVFLVHAPDVRLLLAADAVRVPVRAPASVPLLEQLVLSPSVARVHVPPEVQQNQRECRQVVGIS